MAKTRLNGEGTIIDKVVKKRKKNGEEYELRYKEAQIMLNGKRHATTFSKVRDAQNWLREMRENAEKGVDVGNSITFGEFSKRFLVDKVREGIRHSTITGWKLYLDRHILPKFGHLQLKQITTAMINDFYEEKLSENSMKKHSAKEKISEKLSPNTVNHFHKILHNIFAHAMKQRVVAYNPVAVASKPKRAKTSVNILDTEETLKLLEAARSWNITKSGAVSRHKNPSYPPALATMVYTGVRRSELLGLTWDAVDLENSVINIEATLVQATDRAVYFDDETKTAAGKRSIAIPDELTEILRKHKEVTGKFDFVFCGRDGKRPDPHNFNRFFTSVLKLAGIDRHIRVHDIRHSHVSLLVAAGVNIKEISSRIGHSNFNFTMQTYAHLMPDADRKTADKLSEILSANQVKSGA